MNKNEKTCHIPVIMLMTKSDDESKLILSAVSADDIIVKPVETKALREKIHKILSSRR
ncbi:MAG: response regulator transcription factor [Candidatus Aminicenantes bacterium]|nr:MAG: response regulator transcription factor [Candidatus Aminicenantes bacterium]